MGTEANSEQSEPTSTLPGSRSARTASLEKFRAAVESLDRGGTRSLSLRMTELLVFLMGVIGAVALGLGITDYLVDHLYVSAYLLAYGGFRIADLIVRDDAGTAQERATSLPRQITSQIPLLVLFFAAPFETTYWHPGEPAKWMGGLGLLIGLAGLWIALGARIQLAYFSSTGDNQRALVRSGFYGYIRHPIFAGIELSLLGWPIAYGAPITLLGTILIGAVVAYYRISIEEIELRRIFGAAYDEYVKQTWRIFPKVW